MLPLHSYYQLKILRVRVNPINPLSICKLCLTQVPLYLLLPMGVVHSLLKSPGYDWCDIDAAVV